MFQVQSSYRSSRGPAPWDCLHHHSTPALHSPQADILLEYIRKHGTWTAHLVVRHVPASGVPDLVGPSLSSQRSLPVYRQVSPPPSGAHHEASAASGPRALLLLFFLALLADYLPDYLLASKFLFQAQPFTHPRRTTSEIPNLVGRSQALPQEPVFCFAHPSRLTDSSGCPRTRCGPHRLWTP